MLKNEQIVQLCLYYIITILTPDIIFYFMDYILITYFNNIYCKVKYDKFDKFPYQLYRKGFLITLRNILLINIPAIFLFSKIMELPLLTNYWQLLWLIPTYIITTCFFHLYHWFVHKYCYSIHKQHHDYIKTIAFCASYNSFYDHLVNIPMIGLSMVLQTYEGAMIYLILLNLNNSFVHSGYKCFYNNHHHNHHRYINCNYSEFWFDWLCKTSK
jgi:hypothetical protein